MSPELREAMLYCIEEYISRHYDGEPLGGYIWTFVEEICKADGVESPMDYLQHVDALIYEEAE